MSVSLGATPSSPFSEGLNSLSLWERVGVRAWAFILQWVNDNAVALCRDTASVTLDSIKPAVPKS